MPIINSKVGKNVTIWHEDLVNIYDSEIGRDTKIGSFVEIGKCVVGNNCIISAHCFLCEGVTIEDNVFLGPRVTTTNVRRPRSRSDGTLSQTYISKGATIGANATIVCGVTIGKYAMVGAGAVVTKDVRPYHCVLGSPAVFHHKVDKQGQPWS